jgi:hypothetical protein
LRVVFPSVSGGVAASASAAAKNAVAQRSGSHEFGQVNGEQVEQTVRSVEQRSALLLDFVEGLYGEDSTTNDGTGIGVPCSTLKPEFNSDGTHLNAKYLPLLECTLREALERMW